MVKIYTCQNGLRIVSEHIPYVRSVSVGIWVGAGSRYEEAHENGITHFIEHMLFKGTAMRSARQIAEEFDRIGGEVNAFTSKENTCYYAKVLDHHGELAVSILADMFFNSSFATEEMAKEKQVILEEILMSEDDPSDDIHEQLWRVMYPRDSLGLPILGTKETLSTFTADKIHEYMNKYYHPENVVVSVAGNISADLLRHIEKLFGGYEKTPNAVSVHCTYPEFSSGRYVKNRDVEQSHIAMSYPAVNVKHPNAYSLVAFNNILGGNMSSRLFQEVREDRGLAYTVYSYHTCYVDVGSLTIYAGANNEQRELLFQTMNETLNRVKRDGVTREEVENAKEHLKGSFVLGLESTDSHMSRNGKSELMLGRHKSIDEVIAQIDAVSYESVNDMMKLVLGADPAIAIIGKGV